MQRRQRKVQKGCKLKLHITLEVTNPKGEWIEWHGISVNDANNVLGATGDREDSTEKQGVRESKQNKASRPILTFAP